MPTFAPSFTSISFPTVSAAPASMRGGTFAASSLAETTAFSDGSYADVVSGKYPLNRFLFIYINRAPGKPLDPLVKEFTKFVLSKEGQEIVVKTDFVPVK